MKSTPPPRLLSALFAALCVSAPILAHAQPLYRWNFDGTTGVPVVTAGGGTLTPNGTATFTAPGVSGLTGDNAVSVTNAYTGGVGAGNSVSSNAGNVLTGVGTLTNFTVTMWVNLTAGDLTNFPRLLQLGANANPDSGSNPGVNLLVNAGQLEVGVNSFRASVPAGFSAGNWKFIVFSYDGTTTNPYFSPANNTLYTVSNNAVVLTGSGTAGVSVSGSTGLNTGAPSFLIAPGPAALGASATIYLGNRADGGRGFTGSIDDVRIYNTQLTIAQLEAIRLESAPPPVPGGPPSYWKGAAGTAWNAANWTSDLAGTLVSPLPTDGTAAATFAATGATNLAATVLGAPQNVKSLRFNTQATTVGIGGTHNLTIGDGGVVLDADAGTVTVNTSGQVLLGTNQTWLNNSVNPFTVSSVVGGAFTLSTGGTGTTVLGGANTHSATTIVGGTLKLGNALALGPLNPPLNIEGGALDLNGLNVQVGNLAGTSLGSVTNRSEGTTSTFTVNTPELAAGTFSGHLNNGSATQILAFTKTGPGTLTLGSTSTYTGNALISQGTVVANTALFGAPNASNFGNAQSAGRTITIASGATVRFATNNVLGNQAGNFANLPEIIIDGGTLNATRYNVLGNVTLNGGLLSNSTTEAGPNYFGYQFKGNISVTGATASDISTTVNKGNHLGAQTSFDVGTDSFLTVSAALLNQSGDFANAEGSLVKSGDGTLFLSAANSYTGSTQHLGGKLILGSAASLSDTAAFEVPVSSSVTLELNFFGTELVGSFYIDSDFGAPGTYGALDSDANFKFAWITGIGLIRVPGPDPFVDWIATFYPNPLDPNRAKDADPDNDGMKNFQEFAFDGVPNDGVPSGKVRSRFRTIAGGEALVISFPARSAAVFTGTAPATGTANMLTYTVEGTNDLALFDQAVTDVTLTAPDFAGLPPLTDSGWSYRTFRLTGNIGGATPRGPRGFLRAGVLEVVEVP